MPAVTSLSLQVVERQLDLPPATTTVAGHGLGTSVSVWAMTCRWRSSLGEQAGMKKDAEVHLLLHQRQKGRTQDQAAPRHRRSDRTAPTHQEPRAPPAQPNTPGTHR